MFTFITDPGHGWLEVWAPHLAELGMTHASFSRYSYVKYSALGSVYYLEEDCDAPKFIAAWEAKHGRKIELREHYEHPTAIRRLPRLP
jgi:hypothetical protein